MKCGTCSSFAVVAGACSSCGAGVVRLGTHHRGSRSKRRPSTSSEAWRDVQAKIGAYHERVLNVIRRAEGATDDEIEAVTGLSHQNVSARTNELRKAGRIVDSGVRRRTRHGRPAAVWYEAEREPAQPAML